MLKVKTKEKEKELENLMKAISKMCVLTQKN